MDANILLLMGGGGGGGGKLMMRFQAKSFGDNPITAEYLQLLQNQTLRTGRKGLGTIYIQGRNVDLTNQKC